MEMLGMKEASIKSETYRTFDDVEKQQTDSAFFDSNAQVLYNIINSIGSSSFGIVGIDVWCLDEESSKLEHVEGGWWVSSIFKTSNSDQNKALLRIPSEQNPQIPGEGLAGYFWSTWTSQSTDGKKLEWRNIDAIANDPLQPPNDHVKSIADAGFGKACGMRFHVRGRHRGVIIFLARETALEDLLNTQANVQHLQVSVDLVAALVAYRFSEMASLESRKERMTKIYRRASSKLRVMRLFNQIAKERSDRKLDIELSVRLEEPAMKRSAVDAILECCKYSFEKSKSILAKIKEATVLKAGITTTKCKGGGLKLPPSMSWFESLFTFVGVFVTLLILGLLSTALRDKTGQGILLGPFGALVSLQFSLTQAPPAQPRNGLYGQTVAMTIAILLKMAFPDVSNRWILSPLAAALAISVMAKLGITHPPAGASAIAFVTNEKLMFLSMAHVLLGYVIAIIVSTLGNNLNNVRQYPIYWRLLPKIRCMKMKDGDGKRA